MAYNFGGKALGSVAFDSLNDPIESSEVSHIYVSDICPRFENKYIGNIDKAKSLRESIKKAGLIEPINVVNIEAYLKNRFNDSSELNDKQAAEKKYLEEMSEMGAKYFISSGHRRFKAYISNTLDKDIYTDSEWLEAYSGLKKTCDDLKAGAIYSGSLKKKGVAKVEVENEELYKIPCIVESKNFDKETLFYNDSNTTQRELTGFEIIVNTIDEMKSTGYWDEKIKELTSKRVDDMTDRKVKERVNDLIKRGVINKNSVTLSVDELREVLKGLDYEHIPGIEKNINQMVVEYVAENKQRKVSASNVNYTRKITETFSDKMLEAVYSGRLSYRDATSLLPVYDELDIDETLKKINEGTFVIKGVVKKQTSVKFTSRQLVDLIYDIRNGSKTVDEVISLIEKNEI